jgi:hypothetical protein
MKRRIDHLLLCYSMRSVRRTCELEAHGRELELGTKDRGAMLKVRRYVGYTTLLEVHVAVEDSRKESRETQRRLVLSHRLQMSQRKLVAW